MRGPGGALQRGKEEAEAEINKRVRYLKNKTGNQAADVFHLRDAEYVQMMDRHESNMEKQVKMMLVDRSPPGFSSEAAALAALSRLKYEVLCHTHEHADSMLKFKKAYYVLDRKLRSQSSSAPRAPPCVCCVYAAETTVRLTAVPRAVSGGAGNSKMQRQSSLLRRSTSFLGLFRGRGTRALLTHTSSSVCAETSERVARACSGLCSQERCTAESMARLHISHV